MEDETLKQAAQANPEDKFALVFNRILESLFVDRMEQNEDIFARFMNDQGFHRLVTEWLVSDVYKKLRAKGVSYLDGGSTSEADD